MANLHDYTVTGLLSADIIRIASALESQARMYRLLGNNASTESERAYHDLQAAHLDRIRGAIVGAEVLA